MPALFPELEDERLAGFMARLSALAGSPPQVLLLDGGSESQRQQAAQWWACRFNCENAGAGGPCLECGSCRQIAAWEHVDVQAYDGRISNRQDEENPGLIRALSMDNVRALKSALRDPPHGAGLRVTILMGVETDRASAANALLKVLEEPSKTNLFVLLSAQREQLLPTLVSRSHCMVLPWPDPGTERSDDPYREMARDLAEFLRSGRALFPRTSAKSYDAGQAEMALDILQKAVVRCLTGKGGGSEMDGELAGLGPENLSNVSLWTSEARQRIQRQVSPALVLESLMTRLYVLVCSARAARRQRRA